MLPVNVSYRFRSISVFQPGNTPTCNEWNSTSAGYLPNSTAIMPPYIAAVLLPAQNSAGNPWICGPFMLPGGMAAVPLQSPPFQNRGRGLPLQSSCVQNEFGYDHNGSPVILCQAGREYDNFVSKPESILSQIQKTSPRPSGFSYSVSCFRFRNRIVMPSRLWVQAAMYGEVLMSAVQEVG